MAAIARTSDGAFDLEVVDEEVIGHSLSVTLEARPRWWSWRYWAFRWRVSHMIEEGSP